MLTNNNLKIFLALKPIDMRQSYGGLGILVENILRQDPFSGAFFVFTNKKYNRLKVLFWHINGFCIFQKRLEKGRFHKTKGSEESSSIDLTFYQLQGLIQGIDWSQVPIPHPLSYKFL